MTDAKLQRALTTAPAIEEALRCTSHIPERDIRARYIAMHLELDGYVLMRRDERGRFRTGAVR